MRRRWCWAWRVLNWLYGWSYVDTDFHLQAVAVWQRVYLGRVVRAVITYAILSPNSLYSWSKRSNDRSSAIAEMAAQYRTFQIRRRWVSFFEKNLKRISGPHSWIICSQKLESLGYISVADTLSLWLPVWQPPVLKLLNRRFEVCRPCGGDSRISVKFGTAEGNKAEGMQLCNVHPCETYTMCPLWSVGEGINFKMRFSLKNLMRDFWSFSPGRGDPFKRCQWNLARRRGLKVLKLTKGP